MDIIKKYKTTTKIVKINILLYDSKYSMYGVIYTHMSVDNIVYMWITCELCV